MTSHIPPESDSPVARLTLRYVAALAITGVLALVNQQVLQAGLDARLRDERLVSLVRRQRTLSQKLTKTAAAAHLARDPAERRARRDELDETLRVWMRNHEGLRSSDPSLRKSGAVSPQVQEGLEALEPYYKALRSAARDFLIRLDKAPDQIGSDQAALQALRQMLDTEPQFLARVERLADLFNEESAERLDALQFRSQMLLGLMMAMLLVQGGFIFHPAARRLEQAFARLRATARDLARSEETFRRSFENAAVGMARTALDGRILVANGALARFLGIGTDQLLGRPLSDFVFGEDRDSLEHLAQRLTDGDEESAEVELRFCHPDGQPRWALAGVSAVRDDRSVPLYLLWQIQDITEQRRALEAEHEAREFAEAIVDTVREPLVVLGGDLRIRSANRSFYESFDLTPDQVVGRRFHEVGMGEWNMPGLVTKLEDALLDDQPLLNHEITDNFPSIGRRIMLINARRMGGSPGGTAPDALLVAMEDITDRRTAEEALRRSERRYRLMADNATDLITRHLPDGTCLYASPACRSILGRTPESLTGPGLFSLVHPDDEPRLRMSFLSLQEGGYETTTLYRIRRSNGSYLWFETRARLLLDAENATETEDGRPAPTEIVAVSRDVTARQQVEDALRESNELVSAILESITDAFISFDRHWHCTYLNDEAERVLGLNRAEVLGHTVWQDPSRGPAASLRQKCQLALDLNTPVEFEEHDPVTNAWYEVKVYPSHSGLSVYFRDVTERHNAEQMVRQLNQDLQARTVELEAINHELEAFSYSVSHDLRAPLRSIDGFSRALLEDYSDKLDEHGRDFLNRVRRATQRMGHLIDALLNLSRVTRADLTREPVDLSAMAESVLEDLRETEPDRRVCVEIAPGLHGSADPKLVRVALENLIGNAWKFTARREEARIEIGVEKSDDGPDVFFVRDNGAGFDMAYASKLFGAFQRLHSANEFPGTGIGLATVQRIIRRHGGRVWAHGEVDRGATIYFTLAPGVSQPSPQEQAVS